LDGLSGFDGLSCRCDQQAAGGDCYQQETQELLSSHQSILNAQPGR
jgi:hypothetical protein